MACKVASLEGVSAVPTRASHGCCTTLLGTLLGSQDHQTAAMHLSHTYCVRVMADDEKEETLSAGLMEGHVAETVVAC